jgi:hypothetical protein
LCVRASRPRLHQLTIEQCDAQTSGRARSGETNNVPSWRSISTFAMLLPHLLVTAHPEVVPRPIAKCNAPPLLVAAGALES